MLRGSWQANIYPIFIDCSWRKSSSQTPCIARSAHGSFQRLCIVSRALARFLKFLPFLPVVKPHTGYLHSDFGFLDDRNQMGWRSWEGPEPPCGGGNCKMITGIQKAAVVHTTAARSWWSMRAASAPAWRGIPRGSRTWLSPRLRRWSGWMHAGRSTVWARRWRRRRSVTAGCCCRIKPPGDVVA